MPLGQDHYQPGPEAMTAFELARHSVVCELWFLDAVINGHFAGEASRPPASAATCQDLAHGYAESAPFRFPLLAQRIDYIGLRNAPAVAYLNIAIRHSVHHRGMEAAVPAIDVESADEPYPPEDGTIMLSPSF